MQTILPIYDVVVGLHEVVLEVSGGKEGIRDESTIHAAIGRPTTYLDYNPGCDIHTICAILLDSIARNHGFKDGNKRTGLMTVLYTYRINGIYLKFPLMMNKEFAQLVLDVVIEKPAIPETAERLRMLAEKYKSTGVDALYERVKDSIS